jgi:hypothetical protein
VGGLAGGNPFPYDWRQTPLFAAGTVFMPFDPDIDLSRVQSFSVGVQRQFVGRWLASATYLGTRSDNLWNTDTLNPSLFLTQASHPAFFTGADTCVLEGRVYTPCNQPGNIEQRRELRLWAAQNNPALLADAGLLGPVDVMESKSKAEYNGLLTSLRGGISDVDIDFNYTLSRCESDRAIGRGVGSPPNPNQAFHNPQTRDRGRCASDRRHLINLTLVAMTPQFDRPALRIAASNWRVSGIYRWAAGTPLTILSGADWARTGQGGQTANQVSDDIYLDESGTSDRSSSTVPRLPRPRSAATARRSWTSSTASASGAWTWRCLGFSRSGPTGSQPASRRSTCSTPCGRPSRRRVWPRRTSAA